jgi:hypothetical protein
VLARIDQFRVVHLAQLDDRARRVPWAGILRPDTPFGGHKQSGFGVENGMEGLLEYMVPQAVYLAKGG